MNVSVIIPTYNRSKPLQQALSSVYAQTLLPEEVIVIDDGSTDDTKSMIEKHFPSVRYIHQRNRGVSAARNKGILLATGNWLAFLDSDDEWLPDKLHMQIQALDASENKVCHSEEIWIRNGTRVNAMKKHTKRGGWIFPHCLALCLMSPSSIIIHRSVFERVGVFDESLPACEDYDLWLRISALYPVLFIEEPLIKKFGGHPDQLSRKHWGMDRFRIHALEKLLADNFLSEQYRDCTVKTLKEKATIFLNGAKKRGKLDDVAYYQQLIDRYS